MLFIDQISQPYFHLHNLYCTFIQPHLDYGNIMWGQSDHIAQFHKLQKMAFRIIHNKPKLIPSNALFQENGLLPIKKENQDQNM